MRTAFTKALMTVGVLSSLCYIAPSYSASEKDTPKQNTSVKEIAANAGRQNCVKDECFTKTLQAIAWQESSFGKQLVGDSKKITYYYKDGKKTVNVSKKDVYEDNHGLYTRVLNGKTRVVKPVHVSVNSRALSKSALGAFQIKSSTAKYVISEMQLKQFYHLLGDDHALITKLVTDHQFGAAIAANYLKMNYEDAVQRKVKNPWFYAVSRYNGGSKNYAYVNRIKDKMQRLHEV